MSTSTISAKPPAGTHATGDASPDVPNLPPATAKAAAQVRVLQYTPISKDPLEQEREWQLVLKLEKLKQTLAENDEQLNLEINAARKELDSLKASVPSLKDANVPTLSPAAAAKVQALSSPAIQAFSEKMQNAKQKAVQELQQAEKRLHDIRTAIPKEIHGEMKKRYQQARDALPIIEEKVKVARTAYAKAMKANMQDYPTKAILEDQLNAARHKAKYAAFAMIDVAERYPDKQHSEYLAAAEQSRVADELYKKAEAALSDFEKPLHDADKSLKDAEVELNCSKETEEMCKALYENGYVSVSDEANLKKLKGLSPEHPLIAEEKEARKDVFHTIAALKALSYLIEK